jgi:two-component system alkaline phosphatase synthesis response regulator PhoP
MTSLLIVDDDEEVGRLVALLMQSEGHEVAFLHDAREVMPFLQRERPQLVLLDIMMPGQSGIEVLRAIRADPRLKDLPVVMYTALSDDDKRAEAAKLGASGYVVKGAAWTDLYSQIKKYLC